MEYNKVKEYSRKNRKKTDKMITLPSDTNLNGGDDIVILTTAEYEKITSGNNIESNSDNNKINNDVLSMLTDTNRSIEELKTNIEHDVIELSKTDNTYKSIYEKTLKDNEHLKLELEAYQNIKEESISTKIEYEYLKNCYSEIKEYNNNLAIEIETLKNESDKLSKEVNKLNNENNYLKLRYELLLNRGLFERVLNVVKTSNIEVPEGLKSYFDE